jgi:hypothetical protein
VSEFVGRTGSRRVYSYPEPRFTGLVGPFARNFAAGPDNDGGDQPLVVASVTPADNAIDWALLESGTSPNVNVPITPRSSGIVRISGVVTVSNSDAAAHTVQIIIGVNGAVVPAPAGETVTVPANGVVAVPFLTETIPLPIGTTATVEILAVASSNGHLSAVLDSSTLDIQEVTPATG